MKNVKILLLLGVMLVNVMPYINNGKVEWKTTFTAQAQNYYYEHEIINNKYKCVNTDLPLNPDDYFLTNQINPDESCTIAQNQKICQICHNLFVGNSNFCPSCSGNTISLSRGTIFSNSTVISAMNYAWMSVLYLASFGLNCEAGFVITFNTTTNEYSCGQLQPGNDIPCGVKGNMNAHFTPASGNEYIVGWFHVHNPMPINCETPREVGDSDEDRANANSLGLPSLVWDFQANHLGNQLIYPHSLGAPVSYYYGPEQRQIQK